MQGQVPPKPRQADGRHDQRAHPYGNHGAATDNEHGSETHQAMKVVVRRDNLARKHGVAIGDTIEVPEKKGLGLIRIGYATAATTRKRRTKAQIAADEAEHAEALVDPDIEEA